MKILSNRRYDALLGEIECLRIAIEDLEEANKAARSLYFSQIKECDEKVRFIQTLTKDLENANIYNQWLQERLNASEKKVRELQKTKIELEATIEYIKSGL